MRKAFTRVFITQLDKFSPQDQEHIQKAVVRVLGDPGLHSYKRPYLGKHRQEHPANPQHTIFFEYLPSDDVTLFVWLNDYSCLHTTRSHKDPCVEKFGDLKNAGDIDTFARDYHLGRLSVNPRADRPIYITFEALDYFLAFHVLNDGEDGYYALMLSYNDNKMEDIANITKQVFTLFLIAAADHFKNQKQNFEFKIEPNEINKNLIGLLSSNHNTTVWQESQDDEFYYLSLI